MFERDYLVRMMAEFAQGIGLAIRRARHEKDPRAAAIMLEVAIGEATDIDGSVLLSLAPESIATILQVSVVDPGVIEYVAQSIALAGKYHEEGGNASLGALRQKQAKALADAYGFALGTDQFEEEMS